MHIPLFSEEDLESNPEVCFAEYVIRFDCCLSQYDSISVFWFIFFFIPLLFLVGLSSDF